MNLKQFTKLKWIWLSSLPIMPSTTFANQTFPFTHLPEITVTANRTPTIDSQNIADTLIIHQNTLQHYQGLSVLDVLKHHANFATRQNGGQGTASTFYLRGFDSKQILVLIDGIRYSSVSVGSANLHLIPANQIERIEILYGGSGVSLYGSDAMGGVIQIFTKGHHAKHHQMTATIGIGSKNSQQIQTNLQYANTNSQFNIAAGHYQTDGIDATVANHPWGIHHPDNDGFKTQHISTQFQHQFDKKLQVGVSGLFAKSLSEYDSGPYDNTHADQQNGAIQGFVKLQQPKFTTQLKIGKSFDKSTDYNGSSKSHFNSHQQQASLQVNYQLPKGKIITGLENLQQKLDSSFVYKNSQRTVNSGFISYQLNQSKYDLQTSIRHDKNSQYGNKTHYHLGFAYRVNPQTKIGTSIATGFRAPSFNDIQYGVDNIRPESSQTKEIFIQQQNQYHKTRLNVHQAKITDKIALDSNYTSTNIDQANIQGISLHSDWQWGNHLFGMQYDWLKAHDKQGNPLPFQAKEQGKLYVGYQQPNYDVRLEWQWVGKRFNGLQNQNRLSGYGLVNLYTTYQTSPNLRFNARLNNITNHQYTQIKDYHTEGRNSFISMTYQWF